MRLDRPHIHALALILAVPLMSPALAGAAEEEESRADASELDQIIVNATRLPRQIEDIAGTVTVIAADDIEKQIAKDLDDLVRYQPGITMNTAGRGGNQGFIIRGIGGNRVLTLVDGVRSGDIYAAGPASYGKDAYEIDDLKAIEIIRGPASVLYGADAMGGAVVFLTKDPVDYLAPGDNSYLAFRGAAASADEQYKSGLTAVTQLGDLGALLQYTRRDFHEKDLAGPGALNPKNGFSNNLMLKTAWDVNDTHQLKLTMDAVQEDIDYLLLSDIGSSVTESEGLDETNRFRLSLGHDWQADLAVADSIETHVYWQSTDGLQHTQQLRNSFSFIDPTNPASFGGTEAKRITDFEFNQEVAGLGLMFSRSVTTGNAEHSIVYGFNADQTETERPRNRCETEVPTGATTCDIAAYPFAPPEAFPSKTFPDTKTRRHGVYMQDEIIFGASGFTLIPGVRYDRYQMDPTIDGLLDVSALGFDVISVEEGRVSANLGVIYDLTDEVALFAQYAEGFRPPNFDEANQAFVNYGFGYATVPNPDLKPETSRGAEIGVKANLDNAALSFAIYDNRYRDFISSQVIGSESGISLFQDRNIGNARIYGAEATAMWHLDDNWYVRAAAAYAHGDDEEADEPLDTVDPLTGVFALGYDAPDDVWGIESTLTFVDEKQRVSAEDRVTSSGYGLLDITAHFRIGRRASVRLGVLNMTDRQYARWANIQGLAADASESIALAQESGTHVRAGLNFTF